MLTPQQVDLQSEKIIKEINNAKQKRLAEIKKQEILLNYQGNDEVINFSEIVESIREEKAQIHFPTKYASIDKAFGGGFIEGDLVLVTGFSGQGKCHGKGTEILMYNGSVKKVEDIKIGDSIMGNDSTPRKVLSLAKGKEEMYKISHRDTSYVVNESHILSLKKKGITENISLREFLKKGQPTQDSYKGYKTSISFKEKKIELDPYFLGLWLGDGTSSGTDITTIDFEIKDYLKEFSKKEGVSFEEYISEDKAPTIRLSNRKGCKNPVREKLRKYNVLNNKHIPNEYKINSQEVRLQILAGLLDTDGNLNTWKNRKINSTLGKSQAFEFIQKSNTLANDTAFIARSLGFYCRVSKVKKGIKSINFIGEYNKLYISGDITKIPTRIARKKASVNLRANSLHSTIKVEKIGIDNYYGFEIDKNHLYVLGNFTVTHNTSLCFDMTRNMEKYNCMWLPFEESAEELARKVLRFNTRMPNFQTPRNLIKEDLTWIEERILESVLKYDTKVVFLDNLHFITMANNNDESWNKAANTAKTLKKIAKKLGIVVVLIVHLRKTTGGISKAPTYDDISGSSDVIKVADKCLILWRESKRNLDGLIEYTGNNVIDVAKNRQHGILENYTFSWEKGVFKENTPEQLVIDLNEVNYENY